MMRSSEIVKKYLNPVAAWHVIQTAPYNTLLAGRGFSKSFTNGIKQARKLEMMPRSVGLFASPTYTMIYTKTLIPMKAAWEIHFSYLEDVHYVVGKVPPKWFKRPYHRPVKYENVVTFWNGRTIVFASFDRPSQISGGSYDDVDTDEAYLIDKSQYDDYVIPTVRGTHPSFASCPHHLQQSFTSSMPFRNQGEWLLDFRVKAMQDPKMYAFIGWEPNARVQLGSTWMNKAVLGEKAILQMKAEMDSQSYRVMILNHKVKNFGNTFYPALGPKHFYVPEANDKVINTPLHALNFTRDASYDAGSDDYNPDLPIHISHDWGAFNCITIDQEYQREIRFINCMWVKHPDTIDNLADNFCEYYRMHRNKIVYQWGDKSGNVKMANAKLTFFEQFAERLRAKDWRVIRKKVGDVDHLERHNFIAKLHREEDPRMPIIRHNANNCADLRVSLEGAGMKADKKDKSSELNQAIKQQHATHLSDAYDYRLYHALKPREKQTGIDAYSTSLN